jgi:hypothetical protein
VVEWVWHYPLRNATLFERMDWLLCNTTRFLKSWSDRLIGNVRLQMAIAREVLEQLESAGDHRALATHEVASCKDLKVKSLGLSSLQRTIARQQSSLLWMKEGDVLTAFFDAHANAQRRHNHIWSLQQEDRTLLSEEDKAMTIFDFFNDAHAMPPTHSRHIKFEELGLPGQGARPGRLHRPVIRHDLMSAFDTFWRLDTRHFHNTNDAPMVLLPKKGDAEIVSDYRLIALIHSIDKLIDKVLTNRLAPKLGGLVHVN